MAADSTGGGSGGVGVAGPGASGGTRCPKCGRVQQPDFILCPYCGHGAPVVSAYPESEDFGQGSKVVLYLLSLCVPIMGIILGFVFMSNPRGEYKHVGRMMALLGIVPLVWVAAMTLMVLLAAF